MNTIVALATIWPEPGGATPVMLAKFTPVAMAKYEGLGIQYVVVQPKNRLSRQAEFENAAYVVYRTGR